MVILQFLVNGIVGGTIYALMALGFAIVYNTSKIFHVAHGAVYTLAGYVLFLIGAKLGLPFIPAALVTVVLVAFFGGLIELVVYRPLRRRGAGLATYMISSLGLFIFLQNLVAAVFGTETLVIRQGPLEAYDLGVVTLTSLHVVALAVSLAVFAGLQLFFRRSRLGKEMRALANNTELAVTVGIHVDRLYLYILALGSGLAALASVFVSLDVGVRPDTGFAIVLVAAVSVIVGGVGYLPGAAIGAFILGLVQNLAVIEISAAWQNTIAFAILVLFLLFRPQGIFGKKLAVRGA
ncbi:MAG: branched-chain amino acid ABC transporter permease [Candidatus Tectomicrobia bacterium]|uniref:Branched-chain amino acid ABC transporter permease n=1 Tax=Tectimicrobiota bacterium TaxID=2528274 RepID=A0A932GPK6_UNCTE|nr:branched-chain amino acid ABC transporter permease [Candidatus Tectomicrobia bacterium]